ncbi:MAG: nucleotide sugar dehydrogenase [Firmicutes bacterium]|nr:nucleotide sugar dehydrogenase [Bacillota bacterium]
MERKIGVIGLGYVGLPLAIAFANKFANVVGFDVQQKKIEKLQSGFDNTKELTEDALKTTTLQITADPNALIGTNFFVVAVPTPIGKANRPLMSALIKASQIVGSVMQPGAIVVYESTVYPGVTEDICGPVLEQSSGLKRGKDFKLGYSPERINPGDKVHRLETIVKVVSGEDEETLNTIAEVYGAIIDAGVYRAESIKVAEAAKVIENTQRDLNIALVNELAIIFNMLKIPTDAVLEAAGTKWNFLPFKPGLVGGHCIGVDPYYLAYKAEEVGYNPQVILAGRRINDHMGEYVAGQTVKAMITAKQNLCSAKVAVMGLTFKENVPDIRNSRVANILQELRAYGIQAQVHDPLADPQETWEEYGVKLCTDEELQDLDAIVLAVAHDRYLKDGVEGLLAKLHNGEGVIVDVKSTFKRSDFPSAVVYWSL